MPKKLGMGAFFVLCRIIALVTGGARQLVPAVKVHGMTIEALPRSFRLLVFLYATGEEQGQNDEKKGPFHLPRLEWVADTERRVYMQ